MEKQLSTDLQIKCQWCQTNHALEDWDKTTFAECTSREMRRSYMHLSNPKAFKKESEKFYKCPNCAQWLRGNQLVIMSDNTELNKLGGDSIINIVTTK